MKHLLTITEKDITGSDILADVAPRIAVSAVLFDDVQNIALIYRNTDEFYTLPGGGVEQGEDLITALKRELWEETGCHCEVAAELGTIIENRGRCNFAQQRYYYIAHTLGEKGELHLTEEELKEGVTVIWLPLDHAYACIEKKRHSIYQCKFIQRRDMAVLEEVMDRRTSIGL